jgi:5-methylcytosine-specific restriction protein A
VVCSFDFEKFYGSIGEKYIHVHHKISLSEIKKEYKLDPINDLVPVCPNCHAIIHKTRPALTVEQLKIHLLEKDKIT